MALLVYALSSLAVLSVISCGPTPAEIDQLIQQRVSEALAAIPSPTPAPTASLVPTATPAPTATPQPTPTPVSFPSQPTPQPTVTPQPISDFNAVYRDSEKSVFMITSPRSVGTGWLIEPGLILTNEHTLSGLTSLTIRQAQYPPFTARVVASDEPRDIALLEFTPESVPLDPSAQPLPLGRITSNNIAEPLMAIGYSGNESSFGSRGVGSATANVGVLSQVVNLGDQGQGRNLVMDVAIDPGDSGGPILDASGEVVGMSRAVLERTSQGQRVVGTFYAVHIDEIRSALPALKRGESR